MALMAEAIREAKAKNIRLVTLEVRRSNVAASSLYRKLNFEERRLRTNYYGPGEDAIVMELHLGAVRRFSLVLRPIIPQSRIYPQLAFVFARGYKILLFVPYYVNIEPALIGQ